MHLGRCVAVGLFTIVFGVGLVFLPRGTVVIAQPGLQWSQLEVEVAADDLSAIQIRDLLAVFDDALVGLGDSEVVCSP